MDASLIIAIAISVLTVVNVCLFAAICAARDRCIEYNRRCEHQRDLCENKAMICEQYRNDCAKKSEILSNLLNEKKEKKEKKKKKKEA